MTTLIEPSHETNPIATAKQAGLRYVSDDMPGIRRELHDDTIRYIDPKGSEINDEQTLQRIRSLAIPPAYTNVWICPLEHGHLQATGRDAKGRKQYRYHPRWREVRDETKYNRMIAFGEALPAIREHVDQDLRRPGLPREKVLATVVRLLETTFIRVGNDEYARSNKSYGLTTMRDKHAQITSSKVTFSFRGKSHKNHTIDVHDRRLAQIVKRCQDLPGYDLFQYLDEQGQVHDVTSDDVNTYLREIAGERFSAKDFRTWAGTVLAALALQEFELSAAQISRKKNIVHAIEQVSERLGNTPSICRKCYVHPAVIDAYLEGTLTEALTQRVADELAENLDKLPADEAAVLGFLYARLQAETKQDTQKKPKNRKK